ncbi:hypothetical protein NEOLEDRAFT_1070909, partial [Neolentinus lepideus HHB14362 ss-1]
MIINSGQHIASSKFIADCHFLSGLVLKAQSYYVQATLKTQEALQHYQKAGNRLGAAQCLQSIGDILGMESNYSDAKDKLKDAMEQFQQIG